MDGTCTPVQSSSFSICTSRAGISLPEIDVCALRGLGQGLREGADPILCFSQKL